MILYFYNSYSMMWEEEILFKMFLGYSFSQ